MQVPTTLTVSIHAGIIHNGCTFEKLLEKSS